MTCISRYLACLIVAIISIVASNSGLQAQDFALRPGDAVRVYVPRDTGLSGTFDVDLHSVLTLPLVGRVDVAGKPWNQVNAQLMAAYRREVREPGITLTPMRRVIVLGAVNRPGSYLIEPTVTLSGAIAAAEGALADGTVRRVRVTRGSSIIQADASRGLEIADMPVESGDQIFVLQRGWFSRNSNFLITAILSLTGIVATLALR